MPRTNKGGWKTCSRGHKYRGSGGPTLVPETVLTDALLARGYGLYWRAEQPVPDDKVMVTLSFERSP